MKGRAVRSIHKRNLLGAALIVALAAMSASSFAADITPGEARAIAKEAYIYGFPLVDGYRIQYAYHVDRNNPEFKAPWNEIRNMARAFTSEDRAVQTPNSDTPYSMLGLDLRAEPLVLTVPPIEKNRYFSVQLIDSYTHNFAYIGSRATGNEGGSFLIAGPAWKGAQPEGVKEVIQSETELALAVYRTQLLNPGDLDNVKKVQSGYKVQTLSQFLGKPAPAPPPMIEFLKPLTPEQQKTSPEFFSVLNFVLRFCPTHPSEQELMARFAKLDIGAGQTFDVGKLSPELRKAVEDGMVDAWHTLSEFQKAKLDSGEVTSGDLFGTRAFLRNNYLYRMAAAVLGIYGNSQAEAMYPIYAVDAAGEKLDASKSRYTLRFAPGELPPAKAFWSLTMYELPSSLLVANPLNRYLINSPMLPDLKPDSDGGLTLYVQHESPGKDKEPNWLPAPAGQFMAVLRLYWPTEDALNGNWRQPPMKRVE
ncbi:MAG: DUF1254 domain-containing protein [Phycisphaeraceae bacterium]|nr:DUF1254 domain-containing protein [Phycisphaeraceae bacterium]